ncbi:MAG TPA: tetraacyldisaccharide 4'-kinase [Candidatus Eisenbacteria bacterium]|nr:tetraacyldisaccharide 4'-kinase [Candidatus Eisenbacteria bacterium]
MTPAASAKGGLRPWVESAWRDEGGGVATWPLRPLSLLYAVAAGTARWFAARSRRPLAGVTVIAIGGLAVGGAGKTTLARWAARESLARGLRPAILLRGHRSEAASRAPRVVSREEAGATGAADRFGDEAIAHRAALPEGVLVVVGADRFAAARLARDEGADLVLLDDGWEQGRLAWDSLWVAVDPRRPFGNGWTLPAGPLRRPPSNLNQANAIVAIAEDSGEVDEPIAPELLVAAGERPIVRFARRVESWSGASGSAGSGAPGGPILLVSSVGDPDRLERFVRGAGLTPVEHLAFPDHGTWDGGRVARAAAALAARGAATLVVTDKDASRASLLGDVGLPIRILATGLSPVDDPAPLLAALRSPGGPMAAGAPIG